MHRASETKRRGSWSCSSCPHVQLSTTQGPTKGPWGAAFQPFDKILVVRIEYRRNFCIRVLHEILVLLLELRAQAGDEEWLPWARATTYIAGRMEFLSNFKAQWMFMAFVVDRASIDQSCRSCCSGVHSRRQTGRRTERLEITRQWHCEPRCHVLQAPAQFALTFVTSPVSQIFATKRPSDNICSVNLRHAQSTVRCRPTVSRNDFLSVELVKLRVAG